MKEHGYQEEIHIITEYSQKISEEQHLRSLWRNCFGDPKHYEDFYFDKVYAKNRVYAMSDKGMVHLNFYRCKVMGKELELPYIVGVSTDERYRRQGVMRSLLKKAMNDMYEEGIPFTYLMPANVAYYEPFGFQSISKKEEVKIVVISDERMDNLQFITYENIKTFSQREKEQLLDMVDSRLDTQYDVYAIHDEAYYDLLYAEKLCQSGDVVFCFDGERTAANLCSVFAYAMDEDTPYVEQMIVMDVVRQSEAWMQCILSSYFDKNKVVKVALAYPYMIRIVQREIFFDLFGECLLEKLGPAYEKMTDSQLIECLFGEGKNFYFSEIV